MRTTVTLDDDLAQRLRRSASERGIPFKAALNEAIRGGLDHPPSPRSFEVKARRLGPAHADLTKALGLAARLEDAETTAKLRRGK